MCIRDRILGHSHPAVIEAINKAASCGTSYGAPTEKEIILAETIIERVKGIESIRFVNSGTEATMTALRLARGVTNRSKIIKFSGCYHGHSDTLLAAAGSGVATQGISGSDGVPDSAVTIQGNTAFVYIVKTNTAEKKNIDFAYPYYRNQAYCLGLGMTSREMLLSFLAKFLCFLGFLV